MPLQPATNHRRQRAALGYVPALPGRRRLPTPSEFHGGREVSACSVVFLGGPLDGLSAGFPDPPKDLEMLALLVDCELQPCGPEHDCLTACLVPLGDKGDYSGTYLYDRLKKRDFRGRERFRWNAAATKDELA